MSCRPPTRPGPPRQAPPQVDGAHPTANMASMPHGRLGPPLWSFAADAHDCIMVLVRLDRPHTSSWRDAAPVGGLPLRSLWLIPPGAPCRGRGPQTEPDGGKKPGKKRLTEKAPYKFANRVQIAAAYSRYGVAHWLSRSRLADRCAMPSFRSPHALAAPARLRGRRRSPINAPLDQQGPDKAGRLVGQGHGDQHLRLARQPPRQPRARGCAALTGPADHRTRAEDEQTPDGPLAHLRDRAELLLAAGRFLQGRQPEPSVDAPFRARGNFRTVVARGR